MSSPTTDLPVRRDLKSANQPIAGLHPGWIILGVAATAVFMSAPGQSYSVAAFIDPMLADLHLPRTQYSVAYLVATLLGGLTLPWMGRMLDLLGARRMLPIVALLLGLACLWMGSIHHVVALYVGFGMIRCLGQGTLTLISNWMVGEWFQHRRGLATGLIGLGGTLSVMFVPLINDWLIVEIGWRNSWMVLAAAVWIVLVIPGIILVRDRPEDLGLLPDCRRPSDLESPSDLELPSDVSVVAADSVLETCQPTHTSWTMREASRTKTFWKLLAVVSTCSMIGTGLIFHQVSLLAEYDISRTDALRLLGVQALVGTVSSVLFGYLSDRVPARYLLALSMLFLTMALVLLMAMPSRGYMILYSGLLGLQGGIIRSTGTVVWINYYGRLYQGAVRGLALSVMVGAAALGPLPLALSKDYSGDYQLALGCFLVLPVLATVAVLSASPPVKTDSRSSGEGSRRN
jgi:MFS family permease